MTTSALFFIRRAIMLALIAFIMVLPCLLYLSLWPLQAKANTAQAPYIERVLNSWVGEPYNRLELVWGRPTTWFYTEDGRRFLVWAPTTIHYGIYRRSCIRKVLLNYDSVVMAGYWEGDCNPANDKLPNRINWPNYKRFQ
jgi:hypothetical protein